MTAGVILLGYGPQPIDFFKKAQKACGKDSILDQDIARMAGADFAIGEPAALTELRTRLEAGALRAEVSAHPGLSDAATKWLATGNRGMSSNTIFTVLTGVDACNGETPKSCPYDPSDLRRCRLLLEQVPELQADLHKMASVSPVWHELIAIWGTICKVMDKECPNWRKGIGSVNQTYELMRQAILSAKLAGATV